MDKNAKFGTDTLITILEIGDEVLKAIKENQVDQVTSMIDNRDRLINIYKEYVLEKPNDLLNQKAVSKILKQDDVIIKNLQDLKRNLKEDFINLNKNKSKIDRYRQVS